jgi:hypothetical protein
MAKPRRAIDVAPVLSIAVPPRFDAINQRFESIDRRFEAVDRRFDDLDARVTARIDMRFESLSEKIDAVLTQTIVNAGSIRSRR